MRFPITLLAAVAALMIQAGCVTTQSRQPTGPEDFASSNLPPGQTANPDEVLGTAPSASRLQDLGGDFLVYQRITGQMPAALDDLRSVDASVNFTSPISGEPFVYVPGGLWLAGHANDIMVYDPALTKKGMRWCLFAGPRQGNGSFSVEVVALPESIFRQYKPAAQ